MKKQVLAVLTSIALALCPACGQTSGPASSEPSAAQDGAHTIEAKRFNVIPALSTSSDDSEDHEDELTADALEALLGSLDLEGSDQDEDNQVFTLYFLDGVNDLPYASLEDWAQTSTKAGAAILPGFKVSFSTEERWPPSSARTRPA